MAGFFDADLSDSVLEMYCDKRVARLGDGKK